MQKKHLILVLGIILVLAGSLVWLASRPWEEKFFHPAKTVIPAVTIEQSTVTFWQDGQKRGAFKSDKIIIERNDQKYCLLDVKEGVIFQADKPVITDFTAKTMSAHPNQMDFQAKENVAGRAWLGEETVFFCAGQADYQDAARTADLSRNYTCSFSDARISGPSCQINLSQKTASGRETFSLQKANLTIRGQSFFASFPNQTLALTGPIQGEAIADKTKPGEKPLRTALSSSAATFYWKDKKAVLAGDIKVVQAENTLLADEGEYNENDQTLLLNKNVRTITPKGQTKSSSALISLAEKNIQLEGSVQADFKIKTRSP